MLYLYQFQFPDADEEFDYIYEEKKACVKRWTKLSNVRAYYDFFKKHESAFEEEDD